MADNNENQSDKNTTPAVDAPTVDKNDTSAVDKNNTPGNIDKNDTRPPIPKEELVAMTHQPEDYRKPFPNKEDKKKAQEQAADEAKGLMCERPASAVDKSIFKITSTECGEASHSPGIELYMKWLARGGFILLFWSFLVTPLIIANASPSDSDEDLSVGFLAILSLGSFGEALDPRPWDEREIEIFGEDINMSTLTPIFGILSALGATIFTYWIFWFKFSFIRKLKREKFETTTLPSHYTVMIEYLPKLDEVKEESVAAEHFYEAALKEHLKHVLIAARKKKAEYAAKMRAKEKNPSDEPLPEATGEENVDVLFPEIGFARDNHGKMLRDMEEAKLKEQIAEGIIDEDDKRLEKLKKKAEKLVEKKHKKQGGKQGAGKDAGKQGAVGAVDLLENEKEVFRAFVSCDSAKDADLLVEEYKMSEFTLGYFFQPKRLRFAGKKIMLRRAPEPSNLMWENLDAPRKELFWRGVVVKFCVLLMLCFSGYLIMLAKLKQKDAQDASSSDDCPVKAFRMFPVDISNQSTTTFNANWSPPTLSEMLKKTAVDLMVDLNRGMAVVATKASALTYLNQKYGVNVMPKANVFPDCFCSAIGFAGLSSEPRLEKACQTFYDLQVEILTITIGSAIGVVVMNVILKGVLVALAKFERTGTVSEMTISLAFKIFFCQFLNTAAVVYILNSKFFGPVFDGTYNDFNHKWYATVGLALATAMLAGMVTPHLPQAILIPLVTKIKRKVLGSWLAKSPADVHKAYAPPEYDLPTKAGMLLNTVFVCMCFGAGMPIMIVFAAVAMLGACVCDKHLVINCCKKPPAYDEIVLDKTAGIMLFAMLLHTGIGVCMFGEGNVFPSKHAFSFEVPNLSFFSPIVVILKRGFSMGAIAYFLLFLVLLVYFSIQFLTLLFGDAFTAVKVGIENLCCASCKERRKKIKDPERKSHNTRFIDAQIEWREQHEIATYNLSENPKYAVMSAGDVDLEYWVQTGVLAKVLTSEQRAELEKKKDVDGVDGGKKEGDEKNGVEKNGVGGDDKNGVDGGEKKDVGEGSGDVGDKKEEGGNPPPQLE